MLTPEAIEDIRTAAGVAEVVHVRGKLDAKEEPRWEVVMRKPKRVEWKHYRAMAHDPARASDANEVLFRKCCIHPPSAGIDALLDNYPAIPESVAGHKDWEIACGAGAESSEK